MPVWRFWTPGQPQISLEPQQSKWLIGPAMLRVSGDRDAVGLIGASHGPDRLADLGQGAYLTAMAPRPTTFSACPNCGTQHKVVRVEKTALTRPICRECGAPLQARAGKFVLRYSIVRRPKEASGGRYQPPKL